MADSRISFNEFCEICEKIQTRNAHKEKEIILGKFIKKYKELDTSKSTFYPALRLLVPEYERERNAYGLKETTLSRLLTRILCLRGNDANKLENYNKTVANSKSCNDFASAVSEITKKWEAIESKLSIADINEFLNDISQKHAEHKPREVDNAFSKIIKTTTSREHKWIIRIILKNMRLGMGNDKILRIFHQDAADLYDVSNSLSKICTVLQNPNTRLHELDIELFTPFRPMLSLQCDSAVINETLKGDKVFYVENKYDGERFQLHMKNGEYKYFSKNGHEYSGNYGENYDSRGLITPNLSEIFKDINSLILDGEMMGWNKKTRKFGSKGMNYDVKKLKQDNVHQPCFCVFDILLLNDSVLTNRPLSERLNILDNLFEPIEGVILKSPRIEVQTKQELLDEFKKSVEKEDEGICFKDPDSVYKPNNRKGGWWKMKLEYFDGLMNELDVLIIGGYYGDGRRQGLISSFLLGVAVTSGNSSESPKEFHTFAKVSNGFSTEELENLLNKLKPFWEPFEKNKNPDSIVWKKEKPDCWIDPRKSVILQVKASELARTHEFETDYTLRFPRVEKIRYDKPWYNCLTLADLKDLTKNNKAVAKLNARFLTEDDVVEVSPKRAKKSKPEASLLNHLVDVEKKSGLFAGREYCVFTGNEEWSKEVLEVKILEHSGTVVQYAGPNTECIIVGEMTPLVDSLLLNCTCNIVKLNWLLRVFNSSRYIELTPNDMIKISVKTKIEFSNRYDKYGDSYTKPATIESLQSVLNNIQIEGDYINLLPHEFINFDEDLAYNNPLGIFRKCFIYFDKFSIVNHPHSEQISLLKSEEQNFTFYGGIKCNVFNEVTTHIVAHSSDLSRIQTIKDEIQEMAYEIKIVNEQWINACIRTKELVPEQMYLI